MTSAQDLAAARASCARIEQLVGTCLVRAFSLPWVTYAGMCNGWIVGQRAPSAIERPCIEHMGTTPCLVVPRRMTALVLHWAHMESGNPNLEPELAAALAEPYAHAYAIYAPMVTLVPAP